MIGRLKNPANKRVNGDGSYNNELLVSHMRRSGERVEERRRGEGCMEKDGWNREGRGTRDEHREKEKERAFSREKLNLH